MPVKHCCYGKCNNDSRYIGVRPEMDNVTFIPFPKPKRQRDKCERWVRLCGRRFFNINHIRKETYICSKHFVGENGPTQAHPDPIPAMCTDFEKRLLSSKKKRKPPLKRLSPPNKPKRKRLFDLDETIVVAESKSIENDMQMHMPADFGQFGDHDHTYAANFIQMEETDIATSCSGDDIPFLNVEADNEADTKTADVCFDDNEAECTKIEKAVQTDQDSLLVEAGVQTDVCFDDISAEAGVQTDVCFDDISDYTTADFKSKEKLKRRMFLDVVLKNDVSCKFYTGLTLSVFAVVFSWISTKAEKLNYWRGQDTTEATVNQKRGPTRKLSLKEELLLTLMRLRRGFDTEVLSDLFGLHSSNISRIFTTWINFLYLELNFLISWPSKEQVLSSLPKQFKYFPRTRVIIDCTEFFIQKPSLPSSQRVTWSQYKHNNTFKALIGISPTGAFTFISKLFTGSISDRRIVQECGFIDKLQFGDDVMADRGFVIRDVLARKNATLNIPPFTMNKQMSASAVTKTRRIASARIHVERAIGRLKVFKILQGVIPLKLHPLLDQIIVVCAVLCNLDNKLVKN